MITVKLMGGLGNQMFQYALGRQLATLRQTNLCLDLSSYVDLVPGDTPRHYEMDIFNIQASLDGSYHPYRGQNSTKPFGKQLGAALAALGGKKRQPLVREHGFPFQSQVLDAPDGSYLIGYWHTEKYFKDIRNQLVKDFSIKKPPNKANRDMAAKIAKVPAVSLHVRRGDYITNANANRFHGLAPMDYYNAAVKLMAEKVKDPHFFVFSDDPKWTQENIKIGKHTTYVTHNDANTGYEDMRLMTGCRHHIIANSSFSWWGAWLNPRADKVVIAPERWFADPDTDTRDIYAEGWLKL
jgi:hypothetical protein